MRICVQKVRAAAEAILTLCKSKSNRFYILKAGGILVIAKLMTSRNYQIMLPTVGILQESATEGTQSKHQGCHCQY
jgi:hypothetical protein